MDYLYIYSREMTDDEMMMNIIKIVFFCTLLITSQSKLCWFINKTTEGEDTIR